MTTPPTLSLWPFRYFVVLCVDDVGAEFDRPLETRAGKRVVDDEPRTVPMGEIARRRRSVRRMTGLLGVSTNSIVVAGERALDRVEIGRCRRM